MRIVRLTAAFFAAVFVFAAPAAAQKRRDPLAGLDSYITHAMADWKVPGLAIAIVRNDSVIYACGFGVREVGKPGAVDENTIFAVASNTKALTATAIGMLVGEKKLSWNDPALKYLPWLQLSDAWVTRELTVRDLLTHRVGLGTWAGDLLWYGSDRSTQDVLRGVRYVQPASSFRSQYGYTNLMFVAAGEIIPVVSGLSWDEFVQRRIIEPLGMTRTTTSVKALAKLDNVAQPHTLMNGKVTAVPYRNLENAKPAAAVNSSVRDWANWLRFQLAYGKWQGTRLVDSAIIAETHAQQTVLRVSPYTKKLFPSTHFSGYGLGWFLRDYRGRLLVMHDGGMDGMLSQTGFMPEEKIGVAIFTNYDDQSLFNALLYVVLDRLLGAPAQDYSAIMLANQGASQKDVPIAHTRPSLAQTAYTGKFVNPVLGEAKVETRNGDLYLSVLHNPGLSGPLRHWHYDTFEAKWSDVYLDRSLVTFAVGPNGTVESLRFQVRPDFVDPLEYVFTKQK